MGGQTYFAMDIDSVKTGVIKQFLYSGVQHAVLLHFFLNVQNSLPQLGLGLEFRSMGHQIQRGPEVGSREATDPISSVNGLIDRFTNTCENVKTLS